MKMILIAVLTFVSAVASAYDIDAVDFNRYTKMVTVTLIFDGGLQEHNFIPIFDPCNKETDPYGYAVRLEDTGWEDTGTNLIHQVVSFQLQDDSCLPADLTVFAGHANKTISIR